MSESFQMDTISTGDALSLLRNVPDGCAQLVIADPPYNLGPDFGVDTEWRHSPDWLPWCREWLRECHRVLDDNGQIFVYGIHHYIGYVQVALYDLGLQYRRLIIWHYENGWSRSLRTLATHYEPILWFSKSETYTFHAIREPYKSVERMRHPIRKNGKVWTPNPEGRLAGDVWSFPTLAGRRFARERVDHPTQKPLSLTNRMIEHFSNQEDLVVVPFAGSGTECVSAAQHGRHYWAAELNPAYAIMARARVAEALQGIQLGLLPAD